MQLELIVQQKHDTLQAEKLLSRSIRACFGDTGGGFDTKLWDDKDSLTKRAYTCSSYDTTT
ncbi:hypothetical protein SAMN05421807_10854 [Virgibacillus chiguensis]|uniref:Uncharacterized protein n=1 Tax=Virgibacillus chiguensis TaxID=411959 RepID=A0A1M5TLI1_9BACI|nr:hypothetical protein SAMN05421807_10854 [Virgibacillus chiguensis]